jgi:serine/threonine protein kinase
LKYFSNEKRLIYKGFKLENFLLTKKGVLKITDFGFEEANQRAVTPGSDDDNLGF